MVRKRHLLLVPSTHWDREWYKTQAEFNVYLTELFDRVLSRLESGELCSFFTDGQAVIVEDMLTLKPQWRERIARFAAQGKLEIGPFYALTDMYIPSGESFFRNLQYGTEIVRSLGGVPGIPYAPDAFGHNGDLPAILSTAGFDAYFFCRGLGDQLDPPRSEFVWKDRYGHCKILGLAAIVDIFHPETGRWICGAYGLAMNLPRKDGDFRERLEILMNDLKKYSDLPDQLAINGSDHLLPEDDLTGRIDRFNASGADFTAETATIAEFVSRAWRNLDVEKLPSITGELTAGKFFRIVTGTTSSRIDLKIRNAQAQYYLEKIVEPALACAPAGVRELYQEHVDNAWKMLLQNQTHDSICGCGTDAVVREIHIRFDRIEAAMRVVAERLLRLTCGVDELRMIMPSCDAAEIKAAVNRNGGDCAGKLWSFSMVLPDEIDISEYELFDDTGKRWDFIAEYEAPRSTTNGPFLPSGPSGRLCGRMRFYTDMALPGGNCCAAIFFRRKKACETPAAPGRRPPVSLRGGKLVLETPFYTVEDFLTLQDTTDRGDEYDHRPGEDPVTAYNTPWRAGETKTAGTLCSKTFFCEVNVPASAGAAETAHLPVRLEVISSVSDNAVLARIRIDNRAKDHRLQLIVKTPFPFTEYCRQTQMQHILTAVERRNEPESWRDRTEPLRRNFGFIGIKAGEKEFAVMPQGLHEHTAGGSSFALTLLRAVGNLGSTGAGPHIAVPEAQLQGEHDFSVAFSWQGDGASGNALWHRSDRLLNPACSVILHPDVETLPFRDCRLFLESERLLVSAFVYDRMLKKNIVRIFNPTSLPGTGKLSGSFVGSKLTRVRYVRGSIEETSEEIGTDAITLSPGEIATFALRPVSFR